MMSRRDNGHRNDDGGGGGGGGGGGDLDSTLQCRLDAVIAAER